MASRDHSLTAAELRRVLHYDPKTGRFTWRYRPDRNASWNARYAGKEAGYDSPDPPYRVIRINKILHYAHRLAHLYMKGEWPPRGIDHKDGDGFNNRWKNLRLATQSQNLANRKSVGNAAGLKGVRPQLYGRFAATIKVRRKDIYLGMFDTPKEAHDAYVEAAREHFGEFATFD